MGWKCNLGGDKSVDFDDLAPETFDQLGSEEEVSWWTVYNVPAANTARLFRVISACAALAGVDPPERPKTVRESKRLLEMLEMTVDIDEMPMFDGFPQVPIATEKSSTSGALGDSDGLEPSPEPNQSASS